MNTITTAFIQLIYDVIINDVIMLHTCHNDNFVMMAIILNSHNFLWCDYIWYYDVNNVVYLNHHLSADY